MSEQEMLVLLMGYLDGELDGEQRARVEAALEEDPALRRELADMRQLKQLTTAAGADTRTDSELDRFWGAVYNRTERNLAWILLLGGALILIAGALVIFFRNGHVPFGLRVAGGCALAGGVLMLWSVLRERLRALRHDRYSKEVHR